MLLLVQAPSPSSPPATAAILLAMTTMETKKYWMWCAKSEWQHAWKNYQTMAKCLAIFKGTSVKLKTLVARSAVMFVFSTVKTHLYKRNDYIDPISLHFNANSHQWSDPFRQWLFYSYSIVVIVVDENGELAFFITLDSIDIRKC